MTIYDYDYDNDNMIWMIMNYDMLLVGTRVNVPGLR